MRKFLSASSVKQDEPRPPGWMQGMCQFFAKIARKPTPPPSDRANLLQNDRKSQPVSYKISIFANLFSGAAKSLSRWPPCEISHA